jgi:hypothetical protein
VTSIRALEAVCNSDELPEKVTAHGMVVEVSKLMQKVSLCVWC